MHEGIEDGQDDTGELQQGGNPGRRDDRRAPQQPYAAQVDDAGQDGEQQAETDQPGRALAPHHLRRGEIGGVEDQGGDEETEGNRVEDVVEGVQRSEA
ncbi:Uncharacterised protein [Acinetobacter baumannii]|nr:Uncharacterised protein [Acinetobacter baumannii]